MKKSSILKTREAEEYLKVLSEKYELPIYVIRNIVVSQFIALSELIRTNTIENNKNIRFPNLGMFYFNKKKAIRFLEEYGEKDKNPKIIKIREEVQKAFERWKD